MDYLVDAGVAHVYALIMELTLTPDLQAIIQHEIDRLRLESPEEAVQQALSQWEERRRDLIDLGAALDEGDADLDAGKIHRI
jgi:Arc/MetJ-type ribon-helix-helix transcriptional regulator